MLILITRLLDALFSFNQRQESSEVFKNLESNSRRNLQDVDDLKKLNF